MVDHDQKRIEASGRGEVGDKVTRDMLEGVGCSGVNGSEWGNGGMYVGLVLLASHTTLDIFVNVRGQARSPEFSCNELASF